MRRKKLAENLRTTGRRKAKYYEVKNVNIGVLFSCSQANEYQNELQVIFMLNRVKRP